MKQIKLKRRILLTAVLLLGVAIAQYPDWHYRVFSSEPTSLSTDLPNAVFLQRTLQGHWATVYHLTFSPDGQILASASQDNTIKLWNLATGQELRTLKEPHLDIDRPIAFSPDGQKLAVSSSDNPTSEHIVSDISRRSSLRAIERWLQEITFLVFWLFPCGVSPLA